MSKKDSKFTVATCVLMNWEKPIFGKMGMYKDESLYFYSKFIPYARKHNISIIRTDFRFYNKKTKLFEKAWIQDPLLGWIRTQDIKADIVHDLCKHKSYLMPIKEYFNRKKMYGANPLALDKILADKINSYKKFKEFFPLTIAINNKQELMKALNRIETDMIVIKPRQGSSAKGVHILSKKDAENFIPKKDSLVQEFIETERPVKDFRVVFANGRALHYYTRIAKKGSLFSNFSRGAQMKMLAKSQLPRSVQTKWGKLEKELASYPYSLLTADFIVDKQGEAWLIEMNTKPGKVLYRPNGADKALEQIMKAIVENYKLVYANSINKS